MVRGTYVLGISSLLVLIRSLRCLAISVSPRPWPNLTSGRPKSQVPESFSIGTQSRCHPWPRSLDPWRPGKGRGCVGCSHGADTGLGGASQDHVETRDGGMCLSGGAPSCPEKSVGEGMRVPAVGELLSCHFFSLTCPTFHPPCL